MFAKVTAAHPYLLLVARVALGVVFVAHGWQKLVTNGLEGTAAFFGSVGIPAPRLSAALAAFAELGGGIALILGVLLPVAGVALAGTMAGAYWFVHRGNGLFASENGWEYVLVLAVTVLAIGFSDGGRLALDRVLFRRRSA